jgi:uncharacterized protein (TIRG00374 family)
MSSDRTRSEGRDLRRLLAVATSLPVRILVTAGLLALLALTIDWDTVSAALENAEWGWFAVSVIVVFGATLVAATRWLVLLHAAELPASHYEAVRAFLAGTFANNFLPSAFGGDAVRAALVARLGKPLVRALTSVVADRVTSLVCLLALAWIAALILIGDIPGKVLALLGATTALTAAGGIAAVLMLRREGLSRLLPSRVRPWASESARVLRTYLRDHRLQGKVMVLGLSYQAVVLVAFWLIAEALHLDLSVLEFAAAVPPVLLVSTLPISIAGFGVREGAFVVMLSEYGVSSGDATLLSLLIIAALAFASAPGALAIAIRGVPSMESATVDPAQSPALGTGQPDPRAAVADADHGVAVRSE